MATPTFNYEYTENPYLKAALDEQLLAIDEAQKQYKYQTDRALQQAKQTQEKSNRAATADYYNFINPYGLQAEALASKGLKNSGLSQSNAVRGYSGYQNLLGQAASDYADTQADINAQMLSQLAQANADKISARSQYQSNLADDYAQNQALQFDVWQDYQNRLYQKNRDKIEDNRYNREWAYKTR